MNERLPKKLERYIEYFTKDFIDYLNTTAKNTPYKFYISCGLPKKLLKTFGKLSNVSKEMSELKKLGFIFHLWFRSEPAQCCFNQDKFIEYHETFLKEKNN